MNTKLKAGVARRIISPPRGIYLIGYGDRTWGNRGVHDDLTATALVLEDAANRVVILACDLLAINEITLANLRAKSDDNIILCTSHTHSGPIVYADKRASRKNKAYRDYLISQLLDAILEAGKNLQPVSLSWASGQADIAVNRRQRKKDSSTEIGVNPDGVVDHSIGIMQIQTPDAKPFANLVNFCCHNVVLGPRNLLVSADWAGAMRRRVEMATGVPCLFIQGATADLNPDHQWGNADFEAVEELGKRAAQGVLSGMADLTPFGGVPLIFQEREVWFQLEAAAQTPSPPDAYKKKLSETTGIPKLLVSKILNIRYP
ncbi:MAG: neutral/alkaline non-lysosomal ceramidase N-terminal domain-containing protein, partial [Anaerolineales bacterium]|nr:neutral/alkaline non-lysosomal ceramidase N-terminal domain-containing protein [Anaerolineales bacterium]